MDVEQTNGRAGSTVETWAGSTGEPRATTTGKARVERVFAWLENAVAPGS